MLQRGLVAGGGPDGVFEGREAEFDGFVELLGRGEIDAEFKACFRVTVVGGRFGEGGTSRDGGVMMFIVSLEDVRFGVVGVLVRDEE